MGLIDPTMPEPGEKRGPEELDIANAVQAILTLINGQLDGANIANASLTADELVAAVAQQLGLTSGGVVRRGKSIIAAEHTRTNVAYGKLGSTPGTDADEVSDVELTSGGLLLIAYQAMWKESASQAARAAIFLNANQLKVVETSTANPVTQAAAMGGGTSNNQYQSLVSCPVGLLGGNDDTGASSYAGDVGTGQAVGAEVRGSGISVQGGMEFGGTRRIVGDTNPDVFGGFCLVKADPGTYDVSVQFKASSGTVSVKQRSLWVAALGF